MIVLDYKLSSPWNDKAKWPSDFSSVDEMALRYDLLLGDVVLKTDTCDFSAKWGWVPVVDFAVSLRQIVNVLSEHNNTEATFEFTESNAIIRFKQEEGTVRITANYVTCDAYVSFAQLQTTVKEFVDRIGCEFAQQYGSLNKNPSFLRLFCSTKNLNGVRE